MCEPDNTLSKSFPQTPFQASIQTVQVSPATSIGGGDDELEVCQSTREVSSLILGAILCFLLF